MKSLSIVIPAYNEEENFKRGVLEDVNDYFKKQTFNWEVLLVNDGSTDKTLDGLKKFAKTRPGFRVVDIPHGGKVVAVTAGVKEAKNELIFFTDFDQSTPIETIGEFLKKFDDGADIVIAQREVDQSNWSRYEKIRSRAFNILVQLIALPGIKDSQAGFKAFKNEVAKKLFSQLKVTQKTQQGSYKGAFDVELLFLAKKAKLKIATVPVPWHYVKSTKLSASEPIKMLKDVLLVRWQDLISGRHFLPLLLLILLTVPAFKAVFVPGYFSMHDDLQAMRQLVMDKCFKDLQIPCRWSEDLGYGFGYPLFNYYPPLPYLFGQLIHWLGFTFLDTVKVLIILHFLVSGFLMYLLAKEFWGKWGGLVAGIFYVYAPYHAVDIYVRGAINEAWALSWFPLIFWSLYKLIKSSSLKYLTLTALSIALLLLSHNPMLMIFAPWAIVWSSFWLIESKNFSSLLKLVLGGIWAIALSTFFTLPVVFEQKYAHVETLVIGYFNYLAHFANLNQLFISRFWGYGSSQLGPVDGLSFQIGHLHWILSLVALVIAFKLARLKKTVSLLILLILSLTTLSTFMAHERSSFIWSIIKPLEYLQFPWRFLTLSIFGASFLAGSVTLLFDKWRWQIAGFVLLAAMVLYTGYFHPEHYYPNLTDEKKFSGGLWRLQITSGIFDYLPIWVPLPPADPRGDEAQFVGGSGEVKKIFKNSKKQIYQVKADDNSVLQINTFYFPGWEYSVNGRKVTVDPYEDKLLGRPRIHLKRGEYLMKAEFGETTIRKIGDITSLLTWLILLAAILKSKVNSET